jgi:glutamate synthase domain-containing protein 2
MSEYSRPAAYTVFMLDSLIHSIFNWLALLFILALGLGVAAVLVIYLIDVRQSQSTIRRNYPVIGRFRYMFEHLGEFFRQYFFAMDREELPFNRATRSWVYRAAKGVTTNIAFGSTRNMFSPGEPHFLNAVFPLLDEEGEEAPPLIFGPYCTTPYTTTSFFNISGMSYGAISKPAVIALSRGAARAGCWLNTGEGGLSPHHLAADADIVFQIGTAKYGVRNIDGNLSETRLREIATNPQVRMFEIKLSQGAKPGKGGILPGDKVTSEIAAIRGIQMGQPSISPNRHLDMESLNDLLDKIEFIRTVTGKPTGIKAVLGDAQWVTELCRRVNARGAKCAPDFLTIDSADGGTGAAPQPLMDFVGLPLRESLPLVADDLIRHGLRERIRIIVSGKQITPGYVALSLAMGADVVVSARGFMFALGCVQALQCHQNSCPTGITTHNPRLQKGLDPADKSVRVANYHRQIQHDVNMIAHSCGVRHARELKRHHVRLVMHNGQSVNLAQLHPEPLQWVQKNSEVPSL